MFSILKKIFFLLKNLQNYTFIFKSSKAKQGHFANFKISFEKNNTVTWCNKSEKIKLHHINL